MKCFRRWTLLVFLGLQVSGCALWRARNAEPPQVDVSGIYLQDVSPLSATMMVVLDVKNSNKFDLDVDEVNYVVHLDQQEFTKSKTTQKIKLPAQGSAKVEIPLPINFLKAIDGVRRILTGQNVAYVISGSAKVSGISIPFTEKGELNMNGLVKEQR